MKTVLATLALSTLLVAIGGALVVYSGIIDVGADAPHSAPLHAVLETTVDQSARDSGAKTFQPAGQLF